VPAAPSPLPAVPPRPGAGPVADEGKVCRSPIAGTVAKVPIQVGQAIQVNDVLMVLEAMKMETVITAPIAGKVAKINANVGDFVQGGQVLVEFK
jgi:methylmalonyl-CoA carboxyltransferase small subunit